ncbi:MAG: diadenylate cyclase CdaA [Spirochaetaceae bacterium]|jgi:diadenylate cyclase|nr:diadenylate cyclase CdaA [Spirochaetaceae bacterium]
MSEYLNQFSHIYNYISPVLDVLILSFLIYKSYGFLVKTRAIQLVKGATWLALIFGAAYVLHLDTLQWLLNILAPGIFMAIAIAFQPELRKIIMKLGLTEIFKMNRETNLGLLEAAVTAAENLSALRRGMLIVFPRRTDIKDIIETGTRLNAEISSSLIETVFQFDGPLHDGAMIIQGGRIEAAGCFLPLSEQQDIKKSFGTRHRAALGTTEQSDAVVLIVSEETGAISIASDGKLFYDLTPRIIPQKLKSLLDKNSLRRADEEVFEDTEEISAEHTPEAKGLFFEQ